ncbi:MAG: ammonium transporter [Solirubrobacterales bacterium]
MEAFTPDTGDTAWMMMATALVIFMVIGLGLFYAGLVRAKNALNTFMMSIAALAVVGISWALIGYSLAFGEGSGFIGNFDYAFLEGVGFEPYAEGQTIPHLIFFAFQGSFCIITAALVSGAVVERMRFSSYLVFIALWSIFVYPVMAHWVFGGGFLYDAGVLDFAGGISVEMGSGFSALAAALVVGARKDYGRLALLPHNAILVLLGAGILWFGWFGFNGGSGIGTGNQSVLAFTNTLLTPAVCLAVWFVLDAIRGRKVTAIGAATAIIVGCVAITPAGGFISPGWSLVLGVVATFPCYALVAYRPRTRVDETLDVLAVHGLAGMIGILFIGFVAQEAWNGVEAAGLSPNGDGLFYGSASLLGDQVLAALIAPAYAFAVTFVLLKLIGLVSPLRSDEHDEAIGMDAVYHGEEAYPTGEGAILVTPEDGREGERPVKQPA